MIGVVFGAEFMRRIRSRPFLIGTLVGIASVAAISFLPAAFERGLASSSKNIVLAGPAELRSAAATLLRRDERLKIVAQVDAVPQPVTLTFLNENGAAAGVIVLSHAAKGLGAVAYARDPGTFPGARIGRELVPLSIALGTGVPASKLSPYTSSSLEVRGVETRYTTAASADLARGIATFLVVILYIAIIFNSQAVLSSVAEEKTSRIAELLVAAIPPSALLAGKVLAIGVTGAIQLVLWASAGLLFSGGSLFGSDSSGGPSAQSLMELASALSPGIVLAFVTFFVLGFLQYAMLFAAAASLISRTEDLGSITFPLVLPIVVAFMIAQYAVAAPNGATVLVASLVPLISPFVMFTRLAITDVPVWQTLLSIALNVAALAAIVPLSGKVYRIGLLLYGRAPKLSQIWSVLRT